LVEFFLAVKFIPLAWIIFVPRPSFHLGKVTTMSWNLKWWRL
jgi:hypothetical protein